MLKESHLVVCTGEWHCNVASCTSQNKHVLLITFKEHAVMTIGCQVLHEFCGLIFVDQMDTTKSMKFYAPQKFLHVWYEG